jgi:tRNA modification GTPase
MLAGNSCDTKGPRKIIVLNKCDLLSAEGFGIDEMSAGRSDTASFIEKESAAGVPIVEVSAKTGEGLDTLYKLVEEMFLEGALPADGDIITQARHSYLLDGAVGHLKAALSDIEEGVPEDIISIDLKAAYGLLGEIIGQAVGDDVLDRIFEEFCVGK